MKTDFNEETDASKTKVDEEVKQVRRIIKAIRNRSEYSISFDFNLPNHNLLIECNERHHYEPVYFIGDTEKKASERYDLIRYYDRLKREYAEKNGYKLLVIPYWEFDNIEKILSKELGLGEQN